MDTVAEAEEGYWVVSLVESLRAVFNCWRELQFGGVEVCCGDGDGVGGVLGFSLSWALIISTMAFVSVMLFYVYVYV